MLLCYFMLICYDILSCYTLLCSASSFYDAGGAGPRGQDERDGRPAGAIRWALCVKLYDMLYVMLCCVLLLRSMTLEGQGREDKMSAIADLLEPYGACCLLCYVVL
jgi:hypothetical protein